jgi:C-terminal processing protease CtpA/Prc
MRKLLLILTLLLLITSCKKDPDPVETVITDAMAKDTLYYVMKQWYYWYDKPEPSSVNTTNKNNYSDPYELLEAMRYKELDKWSFVADYEEFVAEMQGVFVGHGIRLGLDDAGNARISMIYSGSPLYARGVRRGWIVKSVNGYDIGRILAEQNTAAYNTAFGPGIAGVITRFVFISPEWTEIEIASAKTSFNINSVLLYDTLHLSSGVTGHLVFESFIEPSPQELAVAFKFFEDCNIKDLIVDLRYNSGGYLSVANTLASQIAGKALAASNSVFTVLQYNDKNYSQTNRSVYRFEDPSSNLSLTRLVVISSRSTASASEVVINGLKPYKEIVLIGDSTSGKPVGMNGWPVGEKYFYWPVTFKTINKNNEGDYFDGFAPDKSVTDDITHDFDDRRELCLKEAIHYLENGSFSTKGYDTFYRFPQFSEKPAWREHGLLIDKKSQ